VFASSTGPEGAWLMWTTNTDKKRSSLLQTLAVP